LLALISPISLCARATLEITLINNKSSKKQLFFLEALQFKSRPIKGYLESFENHARLYNITFFFFGGEKFRIEAWCIQTAGRLRRAQQNHHLKK
jgi:hypothetical protein